MKRLEIIELRTSGRDPELLKSHIKKIIEQVEVELKEPAAKAYTRVMLDTDFSIHLFHDSENYESNGSALGLRIADSLKEFGLVNHSIWIEMYKM